MTTTEIQIREAERRRIGLILAHDEAYGRRDLALHLALESDLDVDAAVELMTHARRVDSSQPPIAFDLPGSRDQIFTTTTATAAPRQLGSIVSASIFEERRRQAEAYRQRDAREFA